jgi:hypothetical protein
LHLIKPALPQFAHQQLQQHNCIARERGVNLISCAEMEMRALYSFSSANAPREFGNKLQTV